MGIQNILCKAVAIIKNIQNSDLFTLGRIGIPTDKFVTLPGSGGQNLRRQAGIIALNIIAHQLATIGIIFHIGNVRRRMHSIFVIYENSGLSQPAAQMTKSALATRKRINHESIDDCVNIIRIAKRIDQRLTSA